MLLTGTVLTNGLEGIRKEIHNKCFMHEGVLYLHICEITNTNPGIRM